ncbi:DUF2132 domain-containing protein [bacterium]|nr:DUF2132 domain-containing protein [bacterium]MBT4250809.1 DUF2132 domain-containing protein [bacterium]MBT4597521.1 DUF2132 domain-containing protein [bacterium]MBT6753986.1 DUF2132 domain-containing protein [bacterium]MBT7037555.1 DUF2132 domain-containing protein [bacterium]
MEEKQENTQPNNPLHGVTLKTMLEELRTEYSWQELHEMARINCFDKNPSISSSLKFLRKTTWAREKVEGLYLDLLEERNY